MNTINDPITEKKPQNITEAVLDDKEVHIGTNDQNKRFPFGMSKTTFLLGLGMLVLVLAVTAANTAGVFDFRSQAARRRQANPTPIGGGTVAQQSRARLDAIKGHFESILDETQSLSDEAGEYGNDPLQLDRPYIK